MKVSAVLAIFAAGLASAQGINTLPACAQACLAEAIPKAGCALTDASCQCAPDTQTKLATLAGPCLISKCTSDEAIQAQKAGAAACQALASAVSASASAPASSAPSSSTIAAVTTKVTPAPSNVTPTPTKATTPAATGGAAMATVGFAAAFLAAAVAF